MRNLMQIRLVPVLALLLCGAHFLRLGEWGHTAALAVLAVLAWTRWNWTRYVLFGVLAWAALVWADTTGELLAFRLSTSMDWTRLSLIMAGLVLLTMAGAWFVLSQGHRVFTRCRESDLPRALAFFLTAGLLLAARAKVSFPILLADRFFPGSGGLEVLGLGLYASWLTRVWLEARRTAKLRLRIWTLFSIVFFSQLVLGLAGIGQLLMTGKLHLPVPALILAGPLYRGHGLFMLILFATTIALVGPAWCSHLCYIGAWDGVAAARTKPRGKQLTRFWLWGVRSALLAAVLA
ncbi:MAG: 4Fe-4S binding protein, partial [Desulfovibrio sp.]